MGIPNIVIFQGQAVSELCPDPQYEGRDQKYAHSALYADYIFWKIAKLYNFKDQNILRYTLANNWLKWVRAGYPDLNSR